MTDAQFQTAQDKIDAMTRATRRGTKGTPEEIARYNAIVTEWEAAYALPQAKWVDRQTRDAVLTAVAAKHGLVTL
jgi:hypothetical protein